MMIFGILYTLRLLSEARVGDSGFGAINITADREDQCDVMTIIA